MVQSEMLMSSGSTAKEFLIKEKQAIMVSRGLILISSDFFKWHQGTDIFGSEFKI